MQYIFQSFIDTPYHSLVISTRRVIVGNGYFVTFTPPPLPVSVKYASHCVVRVVSPRGGQTEDNRRGD